MKQWMGCICRAAACPCSSSALLRMRGVLVDMLRDDQTGSLANKSQTKDSYGEALLHVLLVYRLSSSFWIVHKFVIFAEMMSGCGSCCEDHGCRRWRRGTGHWVIAFTCQLGAHKHKLKHRQQHHRPTVPHSLIASLIFLLVLEARSFLCISDDN